jgi:hypothetical protein
MELPDEQRLRFTPEERQRIYLEEKARLERQDFPEDTHRSGLGAVGWIFGGLSALVVLGLIVEKSKDAGPSAAAVVNEAGNPAHDRLMHADLATRATALGLMVVSSGDSCKGRDTFFMGMNSQDNGAFWSVHCTNGKSYAVNISANSTGSTTVLDCAGLKAVADTDCFVTFENQKNRPPRTQQQIKAAIDRLPPRVKKEMMDRLKENIQAAANADAASNR